MCGAGSSVSPANFIKGLLDHPLHAKIPKSQSCPENKWFGSAVRKDCLHMKDAQTEAQIRLIVLFDHIQTCQEGGKCPEFGVMCQHAKNLQKHMEKCTVQPISMWKSSKSRATCGDPNCCMVKSIRAHFEQCKVRSCDVCPRARLLIRELNRRKRPRADCEGKGEDVRQSKRCLTESKRKTQDWWPAWRNVWEICMDFFVDNWLPLIRATCGGVWNPHDKFGKGGWLFGYIWEHLTSFFQYICTRGEGMIPT